MLLGVQFTIFSQTTITEWTYEPLQGTSANPTPNFGAGTSSVVGTGITTGTGTGMNTASGCGAQTASTNAWAFNPMVIGTANETQGAQFNVSTVGHENIIVRWEQRWSGTSVNTVRLQYTTDGSNWTNFTMTSSNTTFCNGALNNGRFETNTTGDLYRRITVDLSEISDVNNNANFAFRVVGAHYQNTGQFRQVTNNSLVSTGGTWRFDNVRVSGTALPPSSDPTVTLVANLAPFAYILNEGPSAHQSFTIAGINLDNDVIISAPSSFEIGLAAAGPYQSSPLVLSPTLGSLSTTSIFVRMQSGLSSGNYGGNISISSDDPSSPNLIAVTGQVVSETIPYVEDFGTTAGSFPIGWVRSGAAATNWNVDLASQSFVIGSAGANLADALGSPILNQEAVITCNRAISTQGHDAVRVSFLARKTAAYTGVVSFDYSIDGVNWTNVPYTDVPNDAQWGLVFFVLPNDAANVDNLRVRFRVTRTNASGNYRIDDFSILPPGVEVNLSASANAGNETDETEITITATLAEPVLDDEVIGLGVTGVNINFKDYNLTSNTILIPAGQTTGTTTFTILNDNLNEGTEVVTLSINSVSFNLQAGDNASVDITITDAAHDAIYLSQMLVSHPTITFDELQNSGTNLYDMTAGFYFFEQGTNSNVVYRADNGVSTTGDTYSYGEVNGIERALGSLNTNPLTPNNFGARIVNTTGQTIHGLNVAYTGEQWRRGTATFDELRFSYSTNASALSNGTWTEVSDLHFVAPNVVGGAAALDGNNPTNQTQFNIPIFGINLPAGQEMWIRWTDLRQVVGTDHGLAVDNVVLTPFVSTQIQADHCGSTNVTMDMVRRAVNVNAPVYRFKVTGANNGGPGWNSNTFVYDSPNRGFKFSNIPGSLWGQTYSVEVAVGDGQGNFGPYGAACNITLINQIPTTQLQASDCGAINVNPGSNLLAITVSGASGYRFRVNGPGVALNTTIEKTMGGGAMRKLKMQEVAGIMQGETYTVEIAVRDAVGNWGAYGVACEVTLAGAPDFVINNDIEMIQVKTAMEVSFSASATHNPFSNDQASLGFGLKLENANETQPIQVMIYTANGQLIEQHLVNVNDLSSARFGANIAAGVYMVDVIQGSNRVVLRQMKN